jgi:large subunit ribosomal protein L10
VKSRQERNDEIEALKTEFDRSHNALLVGFQGIKVEADERLRRELRQANLTYRVVKNTLAIRASEGTPMAQVKEHFTGPTAVALSPNDPVTLAKILSKWAKESPVFTFKAGIVEGRVIEVKDIESLSNMPAKEELISKVMFLINSSAQRLAVVTSGVARNLALVMEQVRAQKEAQGASGGASSAGSAPAADAAPAADQPAAEAAATDAAAVEAPAAEAPATE